MTSKPLLHRSFRHFGSYLGLTFIVASQGGIKAAPFYWDIDNAAVYSGSNAPSGIWNAANVNWSSNSQGLPGTNTTFVAGSDVVFSSGTDATGTYTVTVGTGFAPSVTSIDFQEGHVTLAPTADITTTPGPAGSAIEIVTLTGAATVNVQNMNSTIKTRLAAASGFTKTGFGKLTLDHGNVAFGGYFNAAGQTITVERGLLEMTGNSSSDALSAASIVVKGGAKFLMTGVNAISNNVVINTEAGGISEMISGKSDVIGNISGAGQFILNGTANLGLATTQTFSGNLAGAGLLGINSSNNNFGKLILSGANTFTGTTVFAPGTGITKYGTLELAHNKALQYATINSNYITSVAGESGVTFATGIGTFVVGNITATAGSGIVSNLILQDTAGNAITLQVGNNNGSSNYTGTISGPGSLAKVGTGTLTLDRANTYTGDTAVLAGSNNAFANGAVLNPSTLNLNFSAVGAPTSNIISSSSRLVLGGGQLQMSGAAAAGSSQTFNGLRLNVSASRITVNPSATGIATILNLGAITREKGGLVQFSLPSPATTQNATNGITTTTANVNGILGAWATIGNDWATAVSNGTNNNIVAYAGYTAHATGDIVSNAAANVKVTNSSTTVSTGAGVTDVNTLQLVDTNPRTIDLAAGETLRVGATGGLWFQGSTGHFVGGTVDVGNITAGGADNIDGELIINTGSSATINSKIVDNGTGKVTLVKTGSSDLSILGSNTYTGGTIIALGRINQRSGTALGANVASNTVTILAGGQLFQQYDMNNNFFIAGNGWGEPAVPGSIRMGGRAINGTITLLSNATIGTHGGSGIANNTLAGKITGDYQLGLVAGGSTTTSGGSFTVSNTGNDFTGGLNINGIAGFTGPVQDRIVTVKLGNTEVIPHGINKSDVIITGAPTAESTLDLNGYSETINGLQSAGTVAKAIVTNSSTSTDSTLTLGANDSIATFAGIIRDGSSRKVAVTKTGAGIQTLGGANTYSGTTTINKGTLKADAANTFSANSAVVIADDTSAVLDLADYSQTIKSLSGRGTVNLGTAATTPSAGAILTTGDDTNTTFEGNIVGAGGIKKQGTGTFTITGTNTYLATTQVSAGNLQVGRSGGGQTGSGAVTIDLGGTLSGTGNVRGATTIAGILRPGDTAGGDRGTLTFSDATTSSLILSTGSTTFLTIAGATGNEANPFDGIQTSTLLNGTPGAHDHLDISGGLTLNAGSAINVSLLSGFNPVLGDVYNLLDWAIVNGSLTNNGFNVGTDLVLETSSQMLANGLSWDRSQFLSHGIVFVVPEPGRVLLLMLGFAFAFLRRKR